MTPQASVLGASIISLPNNTGEGEGGGGGEERGKNRSDQPSFSHWISPDLWHRRGEGKGGKCLPSDNFPAVLQGGGKKGSRCFISVDPSV